MGIVLQRRRQARVLTVMTECYGHTEGLRKAQVRRCNVGWRRSRSNNVGNAAKERADVLQMGLRQEVGGPRTFRAQKRRPSG